MSMFHKYEIASMLGARFGLRSYLEIATPTTGNEFKFVDATQFPVRDRLMYYCPEGWSDGEPITLHTPMPFSRGFKDWPLRRYDLVFVDSWHEYENQVEDIELALSLVAPRGLVLIHDCSPPTAEYALPCLPAMEAPGVCNQSWSGVTYAAYLDKVLNDTTLDYVTFWDDHGCGLISKDRKFKDPYPSDELKAAWRTRKPEEQYALFDEHRVELLRLRRPARVFTL